MTDEFDMSLSRRGSIRDSRDSTLPFDDPPHAPSPRNFHTPSPHGSFRDEAFSSPLGARFDIGKGTRRIQAFKFKVGDRVEVRDEPHQTWVNGIVESLQADGRPRVARENKPQAFPFNECRRPLESVSETEEIVRASVASIFNKLTEGSTCVEVDEILKLFETAKVKWPKALSNKKSINRKSFEAIIVSTATSMKITEDELCTKLLEALRQMDE
mmetsp:Transcript_10292/g.12486  ORF Transcript_10292/g.12486 Transcript_10292/m.12486 type:complete len:214 (+) Transcript_10292:103-744(+)